MAVVQEEGEEEEMNAGEECKASSTSSSNAAATGSSSRSSSFGQRYVPICRQSRPAGIVMLLDTDPTAPENVQKSKLLRKLYHIMR